MATRVLVRSHGGLGNQLFQIGRAMLLAAPALPVRRHDIRYKVVFPASPAFADLDAPLPAWAAGLSWCRLPKLCGRLGRPTDVIYIGGWTLVDGYCQQAGDWRGAPAQVAAVLADFRRRLAITPGGSGLLVHLRLGDFFPDEAAQTAHLAARLDGLPAGATLISNRDDLLAAAAPALAARGLVHRPTAADSPEALLRLMAGFAEIRSNDSTLAIWASLLGRARMAVAYPPLAALHATIAAADA